MKVTPSAALRTIEELKDIVEHQNFNVISDHSTYQGCYNIQVICHGELCHYMS